MLLASMVAPFDHGVPLTVATAVRLCAAIVVGYFLYRVVIISPLEGQGRPSVLAIV
jgi:hypothetical protein